MSCGKIKMTIVDQNWLEIRTSKITIAQEKEDVRLAPHIVPDQDITP